MEHDKKKTEEALAEIYRNAQLALQSISDILPETQDMAVKNELHAQHEEYERFSAKEIADKALHVAASICVYTNDHIIVEEV